MRTIVLLFVFLPLVIVSLPACKGLSRKSPTSAMNVTLIDADSNIRLDDWSTGNCSVNLGTDSVWSVRKKTLHGGRQEGVEVIEVNNGHLEFSIAATRGMGLWRGSCGGVRLGWDSPVTELVHPQYVDLDTRGGLGWLEGFVEFVNRCGMVSNGAPGPDEVVSNTGAKTSVDLSLHGKAAYIPARHVSVSIDPKTQTISVTGVVDETMMFGPRLRLTTTISTVIGSNRLTISDKVTNLSAKPQEMQMLYHCNFGTPLLEEGAKFVAPIKHIFPRDARAAEGNMVDWDVYAAPDVNYDEQVHLMTLWSDDKDQTQIMLRNKAADKGVAISFSTKQLPFTTLWKNTGAKENGYVTGLEPGTNYPNNRNYERKKGRVPVLEGGASFEAQVTIAALTNADLVNASAERIQAIQNGRESQVDTQPES